MTEDEFRTMCERHDLTFEYSDDGRVWRAGQASLNEVKEAAKELPREVAVRIWNEVVDSKLAEGYRSNWYWKV